MSLVNYAAVFDSAKTLTPMINSTILGPVVATAVIFVVALVAYFVQKTQLQGRKLLDFFAFAPIAIPSVVLGATFFWFYLLVPLPVIGTLTIIGLAYLTKYMVWFPTRDEIADYVLKNTNYVEPYSPTG